MYLLWHVSNNFAVHINHQELTVHQHHNIIHSDQQESHAKNKKDHNFLLFATHCDDFSNDVHIQYIIVCQ